MGLIGCKNSNSSVNIAPLPRFFAYYFNNIANSDYLCKNDMDMDCRRNTPEPTRPDERDIEYFYDENHWAGFRLRETGEVIIEPQYEAAGDFREGLASVKIDGKWGYIDLTGRMTVAPRYDMACPHWHGWPHTLQNDAGVMYIGPRYDAEGPHTPEGVALVMSNEKWGVIDREGREIIPPVYDYADYGEGRILIEKEGKCGFTDREGREIVPMRYDRASVYLGGLAMVRLDGKWGFIDLDGREIIPLRYESVDYFNNQLAPARLNGTWGYIDGNGGTAIPFVYEKALCFIDGTAGVQRNGKWGFIDGNGETVLPFVYESCYGFSNGLAAVKQDGKWGFIDPTGETVIPFV